MIDEGELDSKIVAISVDDPKASLVNYVNDIEKHFTEWSYLRSDLTTIDRGYRWIYNIHHDIGTHVIHHIFPQIPQSLLIEAASVRLLHLF
ncbi:hypothetical protein VIGAN_07173700 [Vigna angularis var. angularis]|uniref:inorganic diphosphatase n=1 Tax=Vigna angularis var. angularis TaxID=157739 RepID=A0A0S3SJ52_PHAAN|nr:hypothetical protein VIGAN_07173700 [Vigna angularis var. angularis]